MQTTMKVLVSGDVEGKLDQLYTRVKKIQKKAGPFEMLFCVGNFFGHGAKAQTEWMKYVDGKEKAPIPTYILGSNMQEHDTVFKDNNDGELAHNITFLGKKGVFSSTSGLQVAYVSGKEQPSGLDKKHYHFNDDDITSLIESLTSNSAFKGVDVLLTSAWPKGVSQHASPAEGVDDKNKGSSLLAKLAVSLKPRYHFAGLHQTYYERLPYRNHRVLAEAATHVTRFIGLANVGNEDKKKYLYAFNIIPIHEISNDELVKQPEDVTESPFTQKDVQSEQTQPDMSNQYFFDPKSFERRQSQDRGKKRQHYQDGSPQARKQRPPPKPTGPCWFCLGSPQVEKHLVVSVGTHTYLALAKGGLLNDHVLILPIGHYQSTVDLPQEAIDEIQEYKTSLRQMYKSEDKCCVIFERNFRSQHLQLQVVPLPEDKVDVVSEVFQECSQQQKLELNEIPKHSDLKQIISTGSPFFYVELDSGQKLFHRIKKGFPLQFGREVLACPELLNMPDRVDWKACAVSKDTESTMAADFRKKFKEFDFTLK
ncbi:CWF19-like protein 1 [Ptychodera flava]|uniref:CWF19-like protein 1 n=1 Tax=Ptychodera flava TaxID=63121 RepID=UPI00396A22B2